MVEDLAYVLVRLEQAVKETAAGMRQGMMMVGGLFWIGKKASERTSPERMKPVMDAVRDAPDRITLVRHYQTSDSRRVFVTDWLEIKTAEHRLVIKAKQDWQRLYNILEKRCPNAKLVA